MVVTILDLFWILDRCELRELSNFFVPHPPPHAQNGILTREFRLWLLFFLKLAYPIIIDHTDTLLATFSFLHTIPSPSPNMSMCQYHFSENNMLFMTLKYPKKSLSFPSKSVALQELNKQPVMHAYLLEKGKWKEKKN